MKQKVCKKCQKPLPKDCKYKYCEACRNKQVDNVKKVGIPAFGVVVTTGLCGLGRICVKVIKERIKTRF